MSYSDICGGVNYPGISLSLTRAGSCPISSGGYSELIAAKCAAIRSADWLGDRFSFSCSGREKVWLSGQSPGLAPSQNPRPYVAKSYFETYKSYDHMQKIGPISQNFNEILTFENMETMRFCHTLTYENRRNSLNFWDRGLIFWI